MSDAPVVLLVEDEPLMMDLLVQAVQRFAPAAQIQTAVTVAHATVIAQRSPPNLIIADYHLADGKALRLIDAARQSNPRCRAVVLSGDGDVARTMQLADGITFLTKPIELMTLMMLLQQWVREQPA